MLELGTLDFYLSVGQLSASDLEASSMALFDEWDGFVDQHLKIPDYSLRLQVEDGSVKGWGMIAATLGTLYFGIGKYGDFISGLKTITEQVSATNEFLVQQAKQRFSCPENDAKSKKHGGALAEINRLFVRVRDGRLTAAQATELAKHALGEEANNSSDFISEMANAFKNCPRSLTQQSFPFEDFSEESLLTESGLVGQRKPRQPSPRPVPPFSQHLLIEVWRESKRNLKQTRVVVK